MTTSRRVWDPAVRVLHWTLAASFALGWATTEWLGDWHQPVGYAALAIVAAAHRLGLRRPALRALRAVRARTARHPGLRAARARGGASRATSATTRSAPAWCWRLFACIGGLALTGWLYTTDRFWGDETVERIHVALAWTGLALVLLHVAGVALASFRHRENLVAAMISGDKREPEEHDIA